LTSPLSAKYTVVPDGGGVPLGAATGVPAAGEEGTTLELTDAEAVVVGPGELCAGEDVAAVLPTAVDDVLEQPASSASAAANGRASLTVRNADIGVTNLTGSGELTPRRRERTIGWWATRNELATGQLALRAAASSPVRPSSLASASGAI
jgi:hypothetical protein